MTDRGPLTAVSPLDGRYVGDTEPLVAYASESALIRARIQVEVEYLCALADLEETPLTLSDGDRADLRELYLSFDLEDARTVKQVETEGWRGYGPTGHDVKAVEYYIREHTDEAIHPWIHFALTSEDVTNLARRVLVGSGVEEVLLPALRELREGLVSMAREHRDLPMLARTHGQPATPTTAGKEFAVYASRLGRAIGRIDHAAAGLRGKLGGASGTYAAHTVAYPAVDWRAFAREFVASIGLEYEPVTTQVNPGDDLAELFDALRGANSVVLDLDRDAWRYISDGYLRQAADAGETGSSTMPHKVNPIDFENSEGNLEKANADLSFLAGQVTTSRLQRDLSDSTVKRTIGATMAHCLLGYTRAAEGVAAVTPDEAAIREDLRASPAVLGEAVQTILRREGRADAYEQVKDLTRDEAVTMETFQALFESLDLDEAVRTELRELDPVSYIGLAPDLVDDVVEDS